MLEKMGLPSKPSLRGNNWVVDASHCQGCSSQFTFLNRKHHCRRCGGIYCNSCTQLRMVLRGQGDSPVRICIPCKKLEEAARFELRHARRNKTTTKGNSKGASSSVDEDDDNEMVDSGREINDHDGDAHVFENSEMESASPEELRRQAMDEKNKYKVLKGEGKSAEALKALKRGKELEREAAALELQVRKNRRKASATSVIPEAQKNENVSLFQKGKEKDDLTSELRDLGWSDMDIRDTEVKPATKSLEGELLSLLGHESRKTSHSKASSGLDKSQVVALKKKALVLKREGKLAEAKEELKKAKILEKQLEEQEFLADADDSDDELSALVRSLDNDKQDGYSAEFHLDFGADLSNLSGVGGDFGFDGNFEVTDDDMYDPDMAAALQSLGWSEEPLEVDDSVLQSTSVDREALANEIVNLKKEAVNQKRGGNMEEAMSLLRKAKILEKDLDSLEGEKASEVSRPNAVAATTILNLEKKPAKSRLMIQKELLALKKKALALRREGKLEEADEELKKGKVLEQQLEEMDTSSKIETKTNVSSVTSEPVNPAVEDEDVTDQDLHDPSYLSLLKNMGWQEEDNAPTISSSEDSRHMAEAFLGNSDVLSTNVKVAKPRRNKAEILRELLGLKRKALALRRQGHDTEAEEVLASAKGLEEQLAEMEAPPSKEVLSDFSEQKAAPESSKQESQPEITDTKKVVAQTPLKRSAEANDDSEKRQALSPSVSPDGQKSPLQQEILAHKRKALALKKEGKLVEARAELRKAKLLENSMEEEKLESSSVPTAMDASSSTVSSTLSEEHSSTMTEERKPPHSAPKPLSSQDRFKMQRECLSHKRNALKLRREGRTEEAEAELELAKTLEAQLEGVNSSSVVGPAEDVGVEDLFDPQLLTALKAIGLHDAHVASPAPPSPVKVELSTSSSSKNTPSEERVQLEAQIKAEKVKAVNLKRGGKQAEALDALRRAKQMEKRLSSISM